MQLDANGLLVVIGLVMFVLAAFDLISTAIMQGGGEASFSDKRAYVSDITFALGACILVAIGKLGGL